MSDARVGKPVWAESSHAVALVHLGRRVTSVSIYPEGRNSGSVGFDAPAEPTEQDHADDVMFTVAGVIAEQYAGSPREQGHASDMSRILASSRRTHYPLAAHYARRGTPYR